MNEPCALVDNRLNRIPGDERDSIWDGHLLFDKMGLLAGVAVSRCHEAERFLAEIAGNLPIEIVDVVLCPCDL